MQVVERTVKIPQLQLVEKIVGALGLEVQKTAVSQLHFVTVVDTPFVAQMLSMVFATMEFPQLRVDRAVDAPIMQVVQFGLLL